MNSKELGKYDKVELIPWDPRDEKHYQRMYDQRIACGWRHEEVPEWKEKMLKGTKFLYWIILSETLLDREKMLEEHVRRYGDEREELVDTAATVCNTPRTPTRRKFLPIGHLALESLPDMNAKFSLPGSTLWIKSVYVSWVLHARGLGRSAMAQTEQLASLPPLNATIIALDTVKREYQLQEDSIKTMYDDRGHKRPEELRTNEDWYLRQGYEVFKEIQDSYDWTNPVSGEIIKLPVIFMSKTIV